MAVFKTIAYIAGAITCGLAGYLYKIVQESNYLDGIAKVPKDDIVGFHIVAAIVLIWLLVNWVFKLVSRAFLIGLITIVLIVEGTFIGLNLTGIVVEKPQTLQQQLLDKGKELVDELKELTSN